MAAEQKAIVSPSNNLLIALLVLACGWLLYLLSPVLMPFLIAMLLAYLGDPLVDRLENKGIVRGWAVVIVFGVLLLAGLMLLLILLPMLSSQIAALFKRLPGYISLLQQTVEPWLAANNISIQMFDLQTVKQALSQYWTEVGQVAGGVFGYMTRSGMAVLQWLTNLLLVPVLTFYLLRDWDLLVARVRELLPRRHAEQIIKLSLECDDMLAGFLRGQLMVMLALSVLYTLGLSFIGLDLSLLLGVIAGIVSFVPYLGLIVGILLAGTAAFFQFHEWLPVLMVFVVFGLAQLVEGTVLTPRFVGERIGLHPVAVIFAVMAGGQLFGFTGILLALPVTAVVMVLLRHAHQRYLNSELYS